MSNIFDALPDDLTEEQFIFLVEQGNFRIERIVSKGHASPQSGWYDQDRSEWVMVLRGRAALSFDDGESVILEEGDFVNIEAHRKHRVEWTAPEVETVWLAVHY